MTGANLDLEAQFTTDFRDVNTTSDISMNTPANSILLSERIHAMIWSTEIPFPVPQPKKHQSKYQLILLSKTYALV